MTLTKTGIETIENQGETSFCWLFAVARSIVKSMWMRLGLMCSCLHGQLIKNKFSNRFEHRYQKPSNRVAKAKRLVPDCSSRNMFWSDSQDTET